MSVKKRINEVCFDPNIALEYWHNYLKAILLSSLHFTFSLPLINRVEEQNWSWLSYSRSWVSLLPPCEGSGPINKPGFCSFTNNVSIAGQNQSRERRDRWDAWFKGSIVAALPLFDQWTGTIIANHNESAIEGRKLCCVHDALWDGW